MIFIKTKEDRNESSLADVRRVPNWGLARGYRERYFVILWNYVCKDSFWGSFKVLTSQRV